MRYVSTRALSPAVGFTEALLQGLAPDGGLYVPEVWPRMAGEALLALEGLSYAEVAAQTLLAFSGDEVGAELARRVAEAAYAPFASPVVAPLRQLDARLWLLELFHGPTLAFKDIAMRLLAGLYEVVLEARDERLTIVCATSGDTGGAAVDAFAGSSRIRIAALFPEGRISEVQRRFMTTSGRANVRALAVAGDFDDCQRIVKSLFADAAFAREVRLSGVNSINWARILAQSVYYLTAGAALGAMRGREVSFIVPTGNFGDAFAGYAAHRLGLPIDRLLIATNGNDILARAFADGVYRRGPVLPTMSPAMDIQAASNFERLFFEMTLREGAKTRAAFEGFAAGGEVILPPDGAGRAGGPRFEGASVSEAETAAAMDLAFRRYGEMLDPHTAVALAAALRRPEPGPQIVLATAHPAKFPEAVAAAVGTPPTAPERSLRVMQGDERIDRVAADVGAVAAALRAFAAA
jgi:threonine synthase